MAEEMFAPAGSVVLPDEDELLAQTGDVDPEELPGDWSDAKSREDEV